MYEDRDWIAMSPVMLPATSPRATVPITSLAKLPPAASDREKLARLLNISSEQMSYITNADAGCGLIKYGSALVPFVNRFPRDTKLYQLMTTKPGEGVFGGDTKRQA